MKLFGFLLVTLSSLWTLTNAQDRELLYLLRACGGKETAEEMLQCVAENAAKPIYTACHESSSLVEFGDCVVQTVDSECITSTTGTDIVACLSSLDVPPTGKEDFFRNSGCFDQVVTCMSEKAQALFSSIPECVPTTTSELIQCASQNMQECEASCAGTTIPTLDLNPINVATCSGLNSNVMNPLCDTVSCCDACVAPFENLMNCMVNEVLNYLPLDCALSCDLPTDTTPPFVRRRRLGLVTSGTVDRKLGRRRRRKRTRRQATRRVRNCVWGLAASNVTAAVDNSQDPAGNFFDCLTSGYLQFWKSDQTA